MIGKVLCGVLGGIFVGALATEILQRRKKSKTTRRFRKLRNMAGNALDRIAGMF